METRRSKKMRVDDSARRVLECTFNSGFLTWYEGEELGACSSLMRNLWKDHHRERHYVPLLDVLNELNRLNYCSYCGHQMYITDSKCQCAEDEPCDSGWPKNVDPRGTEGWPDLSVYEKSMSLAGYTGFLVENYRSFFDYNNLNSTASIPTDFQPSWYHPGLRYLKEHSPNRLLFMLHLTAASMGTHELRGGNLHHFQDAFGQIGFDANSGSSWRDWHWGEIESMIPVDNAALSKYAFETPHHILILGPVLFQDLALFAPFFRDGKLLIPDNLEPHCIPHKWVDSMEGLMRRGILRFNDETYEYETLDE